MPKMLTVRQAAETIGCSTRWVRQLIKLGKLSAHRVSYIGTKQGYRYEIPRGAAMQYRRRSKAFVRGRPRTNNQSQ